MGCKLWQGGDEKQEELGYILLWSQQDLQRPGCSQQRKGRNPDDNQDFVLAYPLVKWEKMWGGKFWSCKLMIFLKHLSEKVRRYLDMIVEFREDTPAQDRHLKVISIKRTFEVMEQCELV